MLLFLSWKRNCTPSSDSVTECRVLRPVRLFSFCDHRLFKCWFSWILFFSLSFGFVDVHCAFCCSIVILFLTWILTQPPFYFCFLAEECHDWGCSNCDSVICCHHQQQRQNCTWCHYWGSNCYCCRVHKLPYLNEWKWMSCWFSCMFWKGIAHSVSFVKC